MPELLDLGDFEGGPSGGRILRARGDAISALSPSSISMFLTCPEQYRQSYLLGNWGPTYPAMVLGTAYHHALKKNYEWKMWSKDDLSPSEIASYYSQGWGQAVSRAGDELHFSEKAPEEQVFELGLEMVQHYIKTVAPTIQPIGVEERVEWHVEGVPIPVMGYLDVRESNRIIDTKTIDKTGRSYTPQAKWKVAALIYMGAYADCMFEWHVQGKDDWKQIQTGANTPTMTMHNTRARREIAENLVRLTYEQMQELSGRYGAEQTWPGTGLVHHGVCGACSQRRRCAWQR